MIREASSIIEVIQVCYRFDDPGAIEREIKGITEAMTQYGLNHGTIITVGTVREIEISGMRITATEAWKWLLQRN